MSSNNYQEVLYRVAEETLESLAFMFIESEEEKKGRESEAPTWVRICFSGPFSGSLMVGVGQPVLTELAENMLGTEDEVTVAEKEDALKELANVICGNLLPEIGGKEQIFRLEAPQIISGEEKESQLNRAEPQARIKLPLESGLAEVVLFI